MIGNGDEQVNHVVNVDRKDQAMPVADERRRVELRQPEQIARPVDRARAVDHAGADDGVVELAGADELFARRLREGIGISAGGERGFFGHVAAHVVAVNRDAADVDEAFDVRRLRRIEQVARPADVDRFLLGVAAAGRCRDVKDDVTASDGAAQRVGVGQVTVDDFDPVVEQESGFLW